MKHFITTQEWDKTELDAILDSATRLKADPIQHHLLKGKSIALLFFNPSLRTRTSFELGADQLGAHAVVLEPGKGAWGISFEDGAIMDGSEEEHVKEAAGVLSRYCDLIAIRAFPRFVNWAEDRQDTVIRQFARYSSVPVINMETITHPCQELAHILALKEHVGGDLVGKRYLLTWTWHPKPLNTAVANSAAMIATRFGMNVTLLCPNEQYHLDDRYLDAAKSNADETGGSFDITYDIEQAYDGAEIVYTKSWGALPYFGRWEDEAPMRQHLQHFIVDQPKMNRTDNAVFSHCLPVRRNVKVTDDVLDSPRCIALDEAENRLHVQKALMAHLLNASA
ncbi:MAG: N-acetylornithine carbamoyltransferase [Planctomycetes bacterium]|nr:N-acetylornithine carbamoyltransferase [Planctomycetota bacterium]NOG56062.1 N-acetylornithine carbamoyltransferase [Planctomycetota bacterium]